MRSGRTGMAGGQLQAGGEEDAMRDRGRAGALCAALLAAASGMHGAEAAQMWRGLAVAPEHRCMPYERGDYPYPLSSIRRGAYRR